MAEVNVQALPIRDRRRTGMAILGVDAGSVLTVLMKDLDVPLNLTRRDVQAESAQRFILVATVRHRDAGRQVDPPLLHDRRRPAVAADRLLPGDVLRRVPLKW